MNGIRLTLFLILLASCCPPPPADCKYGFAYVGTIHERDALKSTGLSIRFENLRDIVFDMNREKTFSITAGPDKKGSYWGRGDLFFECDAPEDMIDAMDTLHYQIVKQDRIIQTGKFPLISLKRNYVQHAHLLVITIPPIQIE